MTCPPTAMPPPPPGPPLNGPPPPFSGRPEDGVCPAPFPLVIGRLRTALTPRSFKGITKRVRTYNHQPASPHRAFSGNHCESWQRSTLPSLLSSGGTTPGSLPGRCPRGMNPRRLPEGPCQVRGVRAHRAHCASRRHCAGWRRPPQGSIHARGTTIVHARGLDPSSIGFGSSCSRTTKCSRTASVPTASGVSLGGLGANGLGCPGRRRPLRPAPCCLPRFRPSSIGRIVRLAGIDAWNPPNRTGG